MMVNFQLSWLSGSDVFTIYLQDVVSDVELPTVLKHLRRVYNCKNNVNKVKNRRHARNLLFLPFRRSRADVMCGISLRRCNVELAAAATVALD